MAEELKIIEGNKVIQYKELAPQIEALMDPTVGLIANLANMAAALHQQFGWLWTGFYLAEKDKLILGPFQGPIACTVISKGKGVCGSAWAEAKTLVVTDVNAFPGHIACSSLSQSEIVVPIHNCKNEIIGVLDIDSRDLSTFDEIDKKYLEQIVSYLPC